MHIPVYKHVEEMQLLLTMPNLGHLSDLQGLQIHCVRPNFGRANHPMLIISYVISICRPRPYKIEIVEHSDTQDGNLLRTYEKLDVLMTSCVNGGPRGGG